MTSRELYEIMVNEWLVEKKEILNQYDKGEISHREYKIKILQRHIDRYSSFLEQVKDNDDDFAEQARRGIPGIIARDNQILTGYTNDTKDE